MKTYRPEVRKAGKAFAEWIYSGGDAATMFLQLTQLTVDLAWELRADRTPGRRGLYKRGEIYVRYSRQINPLWEQIVQRYPVQPALIFSPDQDRAPTFDELPLGPAPKGRDEEEFVDEISAVQDGKDRFLLLAHHRAFADFRRCALPACGKYFFPLRPERRYCSKACQREHYRGPEQEKENAEYQKEYYRRWNSKFANFVDAYGHDRLAKVLDVNTDALDKWLRGKTRPRRAHAIIIQRLARESGITLTLKQICRPEKPAATKLSKPLAARRGQGE
jgi:hypothetical protein